MSDNDKPLPPGVTIKPPDRTLKQKVGDGGFNVQNIQKAEKRLAEARTDFPSMARRELQMINGSLHALEEPSALLKDIFAAAVDLKSNSGLFSYELTTAIANSLIDFTEGLTEINTNTLTIIRLHYESLQLVFEQGHDAMTRQQRTEMLEGLQKAVHKYKNAQS